MTWKLATTSVKSGSNTAAATMTLTTIVAIDSWVSRPRSRSDNGAPEALRGSDSVLIAMPDLDINIDPGSERGAAVDGARLS